jgi:hypothetical protein
MFGVPERRAEGNNVHFYVPVAKPVHLGVRLRMTNNTVLPDPSVQSKFNELQKTVLIELTKTEILFKNKPSYDSLERITPQWGVIYDTNNKPQWNKYTEQEFFFDVKEGTYTNAIVDLELIGILITRSTILPKFAVKFVEKDTQGAVIDFDWTTKPSELLPYNPNSKWAQVNPMGADDIEEIDDLNVPVTTDTTNTLTLRSPALIAKEKMDAKEQVKVLFRTADEARQKALAAMSNFFGKYEVSDDESQFSDWVTDDDESTNSEA